MSYITDTSVRTLPEPFLLAVAFPVPVPDAREDGAYEQVPRYPHSPPNLLSVRRHLNSVSFQLGSKVVPRLRESCPLDNHEFL